ncbi:hypothetical protein E2C01_080041 [Portunus trituberculatus]|uniref:Uncharacterized protein n=1 Tax=Portunus trituberculatus TaxID=210409 RepID=A0A5B7IS38_PORTR|nr:hypothetical protein [Portunus trituberculatus]
MDQWTHPGRLRCHTRHNTAVSKPLLHPPRRNMAKLHLNAPRLSQQSPGAMLPAFPRMGGSVWAMGGVGAKVNTVTKELTSEAALLTR